MTGFWVISKVNERPTLYPILNNILHQQDQPQFHLYKIIKGSTNQI